MDRLHAPNHRLKTFFFRVCGLGHHFLRQVDLIRRYSEIPRVIKSGKLDIDVALIQITPPDDNGYCSLGVAVDVAREAIERASLVVGEINTAMPFTYGDTFVSIDDFDLLVRSKRKPVVYDLPEVTLTIDQVAANVASVIKDGDCLSFRSARCSRPWCRT